MTIEAIEFDSAAEATQYADADGGRAIMIDGQYSVVTRRVADRMAEARVEFAYLCDHEMPDGSFRIMTVPVN